MLYNIIQEKNFYDDNVHFTIPDNTKKFEEFTVNYQLLAKYWTCFVEHKLLHPSLSQDELP